MLKPAFLAACRAAVRGCSRATRPTAARRCSWACPGWRRGGSITPMRFLPAAAIEAIRYKVNLPNYGVFDEKRVFASGPVPGPVSFRGVRIGAADLRGHWTDWGDYENVVECMAETGAEMLLVPNGSPYWRDKAEVRLNVTVARVTEAACRSSISIRSAARMSSSSTAPRSRLNADRSIAFQLPAFEEVVLTTQWTRTASGWHCAGGPKARPEKGDRGRLHRLRAGPARLRRQEPFPRRRDRPFGRRQFGLVRGAGRRCDRRRRASAA